MLISDSRRFIFVHVYKVAGMSIRGALEPYGYHPNGTAQHPRDEAAGPVMTMSYPAIRQHATAREIRAALPAEVFAGYFKFAFVRNPWDWQVSLYHYMRDTPEHPRHEVIAALRDFDEYLDWLCPAQVRFQKDFVSDDDGRLLVDFVGRFERLGADFQRVCRVLGIQAELPHRNRSARNRDYRVHYSDATRRLIAEHFRPDIDFFGYTF